MQADEKIALANVRLERAKECLSEAGDLFEAEKYRGTANRLYYSVFHSMRAALALDGTDMKRHSGIISEFRRRFIKTKIFDSKLSDIISALYEMRSESDYDDFYVLSKSDVAEQFENARFFLKSVEDYLIQDPHAAKRHHGK